VSNVSADSNETFVGKYFFENIIPHQSTPCRFFLAAGAKPAMQTLTRRLKILTLFKPARLIGCGVVVALISMDVRTAVPILFEVGLITAVMVIESLSHSGTKRARAAKAVLVPYTLNVTVRG
jgi:hypothetical protein